MIGGTMSKCYDEDHETIKAVAQAIEALYNVPEVGDIYDQQHSDTHMRAVLSLTDALKRLKE
jgi:hypothetical protein